MARWQIGDLYVHPCRIPDRETARHLEHCTPPYRVPAQGPLDLYRGDNLPQALIKDEILPQYSCNERSSGKKDRYIIKDECTGNEEEC
jgi:hypothetical protein